ncbi:hypothetical protein G7Y89_g15685 [Cudoniella acicularis]|uniref:Uncharacterized protein n=1 Tax=Cudoniella acicularis TaxID=354080 RepID=A0A8H4QI36_9HELO|nr:hypothetical protein G7Y89_g15685 [Cudoniella acicularis]
MNPTFEHPPFYNFIPYFIKNPVNTMIKLSGLWAIIKEFLHAMFFYGRLRTKTELPSNFSFAHQVVLITGATSGIGLATAILYVRMGAMSVIITARTARKGAVAKAEIEKQTATTGIVQVRLLNMDTFEGVRGFVNETRKEIHGIDIVILNAGIHNFAHRQSPDGWEGDLQVNTLSTSLLGILILQWMRDLKKPGQLQHLCFIATGAFTDVDIKSKTFPKHDVLRTVNSHDNYVSPRWNYFISKLFLVYAMKELSKLEVKREKENAIIINAVCPGMIKTKVIREFEEKGALHRFIAWMVFYFMASPPGDAGKTIVSATLTTKDEQGNFIQPYWTEEQYLKVGPATDENGNCLSDLPDSTTGSSLLADGLDQSAT